jgi:hypothetical protein
VNVLIHFEPDDGPPQTLYAQMSQAEFDEINQGINGPDAEYTHYQIPSRVEKNGPTNRWLFRASRIRLQKDPSSSIPGINE